MLRSETVKMFALIKSLFPRDEAFKNATPDMVNAWTDMLHDIPFDAACAAIKASVSTSPFPPAISAIRDYATRLNGPRRITAEEAWGLASEAIRTYGLNLVKRDGFIEKPVVESSYEYGGRIYRSVTSTETGLEYEAKRHVPEDVWKLMMHFGYKNMYMSENPDVLRGQFMRAWASHDTEAKEERVLSGVVPELVAITAQVLKQLEEGRGNNE